MFRSLISSILLALMLFSQFYNSAVWLSYELNVEQITELFCVNKEKPDLMCNGKCYVKGELIDIDIFPQAESPVTEVSYLPAIKVYVVNDGIDVAIVLNNYVVENQSTYSIIWESAVPEPPFNPPQA